jgi:hypothetical protein
MQKRNGIPPLPEERQYLAAPGMHRVYRLLGSSPRSLPGSLLLFSLFLLVAACGPTVNEIKPQQAITINKSFQTQATPLATVPTYRCGAWASNNAPTAFNTILILAKLTQDIKSIAGATATATVHFQEGDVTLATQPISDQGGMVSFTLPLQGRQPKGIPATVGVSFTVGKATVTCSPAFFTPQ